MKDIKQTPSWPQVAVARAAWEAAAPEGKEATAEAYKAAVRQCQQERGGDATLVGPHLVR